MPAKTKGSAVTSQALVPIGGAKRDRTADLYNAIVALSQLSYGPKLCSGAPPVEKELEPVGADEIDAEVETEEAEAAEEEEEAVPLEEAEEEDEELLEDASELGEDEDDMAEVIENVEEEEH